LRSLRKEKSEPEVFVIPRIQNEIYWLPACLSRREAPMFPTGITYKPVI
jgi:hypothetical protein